MGIARCPAKLLMREGRREPFRGTVLTLGRQDVHATFDDLKNWANELKFTLNPNIDVTFSKKEMLRNNKFISDTTFFKALGFENVESIDVSDFEHCTLVHDLNKEVPSKLRNAYDLIYDGGTSEHIFNIPQLLKNYYEMLKVGGRIIHQLPVSNSIDHGFYMFSPTLFQDYYTANTWEILDLFIIKVPTRDKVDPYTIYQYEFDKMRYFPGSKQRIALFISAKKTKDSISNAPVQQKRYSDFLWAKKQQTVSSPNAQSVMSSLKRLIPESVKKRLRPAYCAVSPEYQLKCIAKY